MNPRLTLLTTMALVAADLPAGGQTMGDFALPDINAASLRRRATSANVSPRNYLHQATAWYFGREG
jgi:hypothetical protein